MNRLHLITNWALEAESRGHTDEPCVECGGRGVITFGPTYQHPYETTETCLACCGTGRAYGECSCGEVGHLVFLEGLLVCPRCAASCECCGERLTTVCDVDSHAEMCTRCRLELAAIPEELMVGSRVGDGAAADGAGPTPLDPTVACRPISGA